MPTNDTLDQAHLALLLAAAEREDHLLTAPDDLKPRAAKALAKTLIASGLVGEIPVAANQPSWWQAGGEAIGLQLTPTGLTEIAQPPEEQGKRTLALYVSEREELMKRVMFTSRRWTNRHQRPY